VVSRRNFVDGGSNPLPCPKLYTMSNYGMAAPLSDAAFCHLMTTDKKGKVDARCVAIFIKHYPELSHLVGQ